MGAILFDMDGTLIDSTPAILESFEVAFSRLNLSLPSPEKVLKLIGYPLDQMMRLLGVQQEKVVLRLVEEYKSHYLQIHLQKTTLLPGAEEAVIRASQLGPIGVVTTKTTKYSKLLLAQFGLLDRFGVVIGREDVERLKPDPEPVLKALKELRAQKEGSFIIGDTCLDIESGHRAGIGGIGVTTGFWDLEELKECADFLFENVLEGVKWLEKERVGRTN
ncbi:MAG: HAD family hydrolase [Campylobacterales bacterium]